MVTVRKPNRAFRMAVSRGTPKTVKHPRPGLPHQCGSALPIAHVVEPGDAPISAGVVPILPARFVQIGLAISWVGARDTLRLCCYGSWFPGTRSFIAR